jgi:glycosyltransferase involved in cell wall biosynthesis
MISDNRKEKVVGYCMTPYAAGVFTFYTNLKKALEPYPWRLITMGLGPWATERWDNNFAGPDNYLVAPTVTDSSGQAAALVDWVERQRVNIFIATSNQDVEHAAIPHLPISVRSLSGINSIPDASFAAAVASLPNLDGVIVNSQRQLDVLTSRYKVERNFIHLIPQATDVTSWQRTSPFQKDKFLNIFYIGRLDDSSKGIFLLPYIFARLRKEGVPSRAWVVGDGGDRQALETAFRKQALMDDVTFTGRLIPQDIANLLAAQGRKIFLMPSRFEGFGISLIEAMAAGCVPVASYLRGVTDMIVEEGVSGFLAPVGSIHRFSRVLKYLYHHPEVHQRMSEAASQRVATWFNLELMGQRYHQLFTEILEKEPRRRAQRPLKEFCLLSNNQRAWRSRVPRPLKNFIRKWAERCGVHV